MPEIVTNFPMSTQKYEALVRFLIQPFLEAPDSLKLDCEVSPSTSRVWVRVAFDGADKGRVFGRGGRNIQAIRTVLGAIADLSGHSVHLDIYGDAPGHHDDEGPNRESGSKSLPRRSAKRGAPRGRA